MTHSLLQTFVVSFLTLPVGAFTVNKGFVYNTHHQHQTGTISSPLSLSTLRERVLSTTQRKYQSKSKLYQNSIHKIPEDDDTAIPFLDPQDSSFIECFADSIATVDGVEYTIGNPCDTAVALCYFDEGENLIPIELESDLMDEVFPVAASIVEDEFGEELVLERTPQTLTMVGEIEDEDDEEEDEDDEDVGDDTEEVEILLSYEDDDGVEYVLVRILDPVLLVGKAAPGDDKKCVLLSPSESDKVMPALEAMFLEYQDERDSLAS